MTARSLSVVLLLLGLSACGGAAGPPCDDGLALVGVTVIDGWDAAQIYDLSAWPAAPQITRMGATLRLRCGMSILDITPVPDGVDISGQIA